MLPRDWFWFLAGVVVTFGITHVARAWVRERPMQIASATIPSFAVTIAAALALIGVAMGIYSLLSPPGSVASVNPTQPSANAGSLDEVTRRLAARLARTGGSDGEWNLLAESYDYMGRTADAQAARAHISATAPTGTGRPGDGGPASVTLDNQTMAAVAGALEAMRRAH